MAVSDKPWSSFSQADYSPAQWASACLIDTGQGATDSKDRYSLPVKEPDGTLNRNGVHAAAARLNQVQCSPEQRKAAAKKLVSFYKNQLKEDPPANLLKMAGMSQMNSKDLMESVREAPFVVQDQSNDGLNFSGYAAVFNSPTRIADWEGEFEETVLPGAFARTLQERTPVLMFNHGKHPLIGPMPLGVINQAREDQNGLYIEARLTDNWLIQPVRDAIAQGAISGMSFRFAVPDGGDEWVENRGSTPQRYLRDIDCSELGPVVFPAYEPTTANVRSSLDRLTMTSARRSRTRSGNSGIHSVTKKMQERDRLLRLKGII